jgi:hypothetical protein
MKRYDVSFQLESFEPYDDGPWVKYQDVAAAIKAAVEAEREAIWSQLYDAGNALIEPAVKRSNQVDRHIAHVLQGWAEKIRARSQK